MGFLSKNVIPGNHGKVFGTNAERQEDLDKVVDTILSIDGIKNVIIDKEKFPKELKVLTSKMVKIKTIEDRVKVLGFHLIPTGLFEL